MGQLRTTAIKFHTNPLYRGHLFNKQMSTSIHICCSLQTCPFISFTWVACQHTDSEPFPRSF